MTPSLEVAIDVPADPVGVRMVRLVVAGIADEVGFDVHELDDLRIGVDELAYLAVDHDEPPDGPLSVRVEAGEEGLVVRGEILVDVGWAEPEVVTGSLQATLLGGVTDDYGTVVDDGHFRFWLRRRRST